MACFGYFTLQTLQLNHSLSWCKPLSLKTERQTDTQTDRHQQQQQQQYKLKNNYNHIFNNIMSYLLVIPCVRIGYEMVHVDSWSMLDIHVSCGGRLDMTPRGVWEIGYNNLISNKCKWNIIKNAPKYRKQA